MYGRCNKYKGGQPCGCQRFKPFKVDPETCKACECDESFHEAIVNEGAAMQPAAPIQGHAPNFAAHGPEPQPIPATLEKKRKPNDKVLLGGDPEEQGAAGLEGGSDQGGARDGGSEAAAKRAKIKAEPISTAKAGVFDGLLKEFQEKFPEDKYGKFEMRSVNLEWKVHCFALQKGPSSGTAQVQAQKPGGPCCGPGKRRKGVRACCSFWEGKGKGSRCS